MNVTGLQVALIIGATMCFGWCVIEGILWFISHLAWV